MEVVHIEPLMNVFDGYMLWKDANLLWFGKRQQINHYFANAENWEYLEQLLPIWGQLMCPFL